MNFLHDLREVIVSDFDEKGISYPENSGVEHLAQRHLEMRVRRVSQRPRRVHFSDELHDSLGRLVRDVDSGLCSRKQDAYRTAFHLRHLFEAGQNVLPFLHERINYSDSMDGLLWDYGLHHFHLSRKPGNPGFVKRSNWLLYARVMNEDVFFVDVRAHQDPENLLWVKQDLLSILHSNWPDLMEPFRLNGFTGAQITDQQKKELRRKNINVAHEIGGQPVMPVGMGMTGDGHSRLCQFLADKLIHEIELHQSYFESEPGALHAALASAGKDAFAADFRLVKLEDVYLAPDMMANLQATDEVEVGLAKTGFGIIEATTQTLMIVNFQNQQP